MYISSNNRTLMKDGKHHFYLADTCWSAFTNIEEDEWTYYLQKRKSQGFNTLQINILPQWDASEPLKVRTPFVYKSDGNIDFSELNETYFIEARDMAVQAKKEGFDLALVALWCNYIPGTWANSFPKNKITFPLSFLELYTDYIVKYFGDITSLFLVSGDTDFNEVSTEYYLKMSKLLRYRLPNVLQTMHIKGRYTFIPDEIDELIDLYFYQSGHNSADKSMPYKLAQTFYNEKKERPIINSEPCYEQMGFSRQEYGRWTQLDVRKAAWESVLSGGSAGITYGAAGIYSWHRSNKGFVEDVGEGFDTPQAWDRAINFPGANDYSRIKEILGKYEAINIIPKQELLISNKPGVRIGYSNSNLFVYVPFNTKLEFTNQFIFDEKESIIYDLSNYTTSEVEMIRVDNSIFINQHEFLNDVLLVIKIKEKTNG